jgi:hypothetical protein
MGPCFQADEIPMSTRPLQQSHVSKAVSKAAAAKPAHLPDHQRHWVAALTDEKPLATASR